MRQLAASPPAPTGDTERIQKKQKRKSNDATTSCALEKSEEARRLWLEATTYEDLGRVETLLKDALNARKKATTSIASAKKKKKRIREVAELTPSEYRQTGERLSLLYCQSGRAAEAQKGLDYLGFVCRLAREVLDYPPSTAGTAPKHHKKKGQTHPSSSASKSKSKCPCIILDDFLHSEELRHLQSVFEDQQADYWTRHSYRVEPPSPYFSYVIELKPRQKTSKQQPQEYGFIGALARHIQQLPELQAKIPELKQAHFVELWAHNRPHASGHQLHFDSDDEGRGGKIRNPVCSTILYLTTGPNDPKERSGPMVGGPSLVTNQRLSSTRLATKGWLAHPQSLRLVAFDGTVLHGVIPGKGVVSGDNSGGRRVTLMMAFWKHIQIRDEPSPGSARPFPNPNINKDAAATLPKWATALTDPTVKISPHRPKAMKEASPLALSTVYETLEGESWDPGFGMPDYEQVFQGF